MYWWHNCIYLAAANYKVETGNPATLAVNGTPSAKYSQNIVRRYNLA